MSHNNQEQSNLINNVTDKGIDNPIVGNTQLVSFKDETPMLIAEIGSIFEQSFFVTKAQVVNISAEEGWFKYICQKCGMNVGNGVTMSETEKFHDCHKCGIVSDVFHEVSYEIGVKDVSGTTSFLLFESQLSKMLNRSISWLQSKMIMARNPTVVPFEFGFMLNKEFVFRVRITGFGIEDDQSVYTIESVTDDPETIFDVSERLAAKIADREENKSNIINPTPKESATTISGMNDIATHDINQSLETKKRKIENLPCIKDVVPETYITTNKSMATQELKIPKMEKM